MIWRNWMGNQVAEPAAIRSPESLDALCRDVREAAGRGRVRPLGGGYSWSGLMPTNGTMIDLSRLRRCLRVDPHGDPPSVTVECGMSIRELTRLTASHGLTLVSPTIFPHPSLGGAIGTGSHGTGRSVTTISDAVLEMTLVDARGEAIRIGRDDPRLPSARVALGSLGVIHSVTLRCEREFRVNVEDMLFPVDRVLDELDDLLASYEYVELYWFPTNPQMWVKAMNRTHEPLTVDSRLKRLKDKVNAHLSTFAGNWVLPFVSRFLPSLIPPFMQLAPALAFDAGTYVYTASREFHYEHSYPKNWDMSFAVPTTSSREAWRGAIDLVTYYAKQNKFPVTLTLHSRFLGASRSPLAIMEGHPICDIEAVSTARTPNHFAFYRDYENLMFDFPSGRPHWGKYLLDAERIHGRYSRMGEFLAVREALDPGRVFLNDYLEREVFRI